MIKNNTKQKIFKLWNETVEQTVKISNLSTNDTLILEQVGKLNNHNVNIISDKITYDSEWLNPNTIIDDYQDEYRERIITFYKEYNVEIKNILEELVPYVKVFVVYRMGDGEESLPIPVGLWNPTSTYPFPNYPTEDAIPFDEQATISHNQITEIKETVNSGYVDVNYIFSMNVHDDHGFAMPLQFKFYVTLINPYHFQNH